MQIKSPDSDIFFTLLHHASDIAVRILFVTKIDNKPRLVDVSYLAKEFGPEKCTAILGLHEFIGCDTASALLG